MAISVKCYKEQIKNSAKQEMLSISATKTKYINIYVCLKGKKDGKPKIPFKYFRFRLSYALALRLSLSVVFPFDCWLFSLFCLSSSTISSISTHFLYNNIIILCAMMKIYTNWDHPFQRNGFWLKTIKLKKSYRFNRFIVFVRVFLSHCFVRQMLQVILKTRLFSRMYSLACSIYSLKI